jgi:predicted ATPase/class 3 adenylate cyclase
LLVAESVELATILLTDLVGSTRLANSVGPVRADRLREEHFELLRDAIASSDGREVKNTGDGLMVAFGSASAAVQCAVAIQQLFERRYRDAEQALHVRVGLAAGESTVKDGDYFGMPSIEAARLCTEAPTDGILISGWVKHLAGRCEGIEFSSAGQLELKGFPDPVEAFSVSWAPLAEEAGEPAGRWPLPALLRSTPPVAYVGRVQERAALEEARVLAREGSHQILLLSGEPGIGKTRLASYAAHRAHAEGFAVAWGGCSEELAVPYEPWIGVCTQLVEHAPTELLGQHVKRHGGELARLARGMGARVADLPEPQPSDPETERYLLFNAVAGLLGEVAETVPLCVVLDDLHWADAQSVSLLKHMLRASEHGSLQVVATYRDSDLGKAHPLTALLADLHSLQGVQRVALRGLGADEVSEIMAAMAGHELDHEGLSLAAEIAQETDGNPFFVGELLRGLSESGALVFDEDAGRWSVDRTAGIALPQSVREVIERRVDRLGEDSIEVLRLAAVIGREFDLELLAAVAETDETRLLDQLEAAAAASVLAESVERVGRFRFAHGLIGQTLYHGLGATRRARLHHRVAEALEKLYGADPGEHLGELALHWRLAAVSVDRGKAAGYALKAGQRALSSLAPADALRLFSDAAELSSADTRERCRALIGLGEAERQLGLASYRERLLEASHIAFELKDAELAAQAALANNRGFVSVISEVDLERLAAIEQALELDEPPRPARRARLLALEALERTYERDFERRRSNAEAAISLARESCDTRTLAEVLSLICEPLRVPETLDLRGGLIEELIACAAELGDPALEYWANTQNFHNSSEQCNFQRAAPALQELERISRELDQPGLKWQSMFVRAGWELARGDLAAGEELSRSAFELGRELGEPDAFFALGTHLAFARRYQGRVAEIIDAVKQKTETASLASERAGLPWMLCAADRRAEAGLALAHAARDDFEWMPQNNSWLTALALYAESAAETSSRDVAASLYRLMEPWAGQFVWNGLSGYGHVHLYLGLLAACIGEDHRRADEHLAFACEFHEANEMPLWAARSHLGWGDALAARGETEAAREHASRALELSREHGYGLFEPRAVALVETGSAAGA